MPSLEINYPSCSELIATVSADKIDDVRNVLSEIERITGWKVGISYATLNPKKKDGEKGRRIHQFKPVSVDSVIISENPDNDENSLTITNPPQNQDGIGLVISKSHKSSGNKRHGANDDISVYYGFGDREGLTFVCGDYETQIYPFLAKLHQHFGVDVSSYDGGGDSWYEHWCAMHDIIPKDDCNTECHPDEETGKCFCQSALPINISDSKHKTGKTSGLIVPSGKDWRDMVGK